MPHEASELSKIRMWRRQEPPNETTPWRNIVEILAKKNRKGEIKKENQATQKVWKFGNLAVWGFGALEICNISSDESVHWGRLDDEKLHRIAQSYIIKTRGKSKQTKIKQIKFIRKINKIKDKR